MREPRGQHAGELAATAECPTAEDLQSGGVSRVELCCRLPPQLQPALPTGLVDSRVGDLAGFPVGGRRDAATALSSCRALMAASKASCGAAVANDERTMLLVSCPRKPHDGAAHTTQPCRTCSLLPTPAGCRCGRSFEKCQRPAASRTAKRWLPARMDTVWSRLAPAGNGEPPRSRQNSPLLTTPSRIYESWLRINVG